MNLAPRPYLLDFVNAVRPGWEWAVGVSGTPEQMARREPSTNSVWLNGPRAQLNLFVGNVAVAIWVRRLNDARECIGVVGQDSTRGTSLPESLPGLEERIQRALAVFDAENERSGL